MFKVSQIAANRLDVEFSERLDAEAMKRALDELVEKSEGIEHGRMMYRIGDFDFPTFGAIAVELSQLPRLFRFMRRFDKVAVLAAQNWVRTASEIEGALIPGLEIKAFAPGAEADAERWLA